MSTIVKTLVVDDSAFMRNILKRILSTTNKYVVVGEAENGNDAVKKAEELSPDLISMDIVMPEKDGIQATKEIKEKFPGIKVVMCTSVDQEQKMIEAVNAGADGYIVKPFQAPKILEQFNKLFP
ncbi:two-component system chemotaxis response regulator CheY [Methanococcus voltae]|uniref:Two-component system chemotaxis response regulator CheY n=2 Tax=Methanococcus voltae TaxID=2188 RepID=A0A8J7USV1_METVO|nr:response regulator [Methanococcus voltae]MBP2142911.1 two-component system chemotaxis response regulator CheY [Methanococcus voltae]MBP2172021.1 two-component system chemotaxis response regulator CheY [Methanococcus voltae]MBP2201024.1 two-component system chemotaxis response regulator CheY [Methanococcus voltae]MCS3921746.1 two-component system chemotaxis response regulator CheY [Methanococcus voltae PS]